MLTSEVSLHSLDLEYGSRATAFVEERCILDILFLDS